MTDFMRPTEDLLVSQALLPVAATTGARNGVAIDMLDYEGCCFILTVGDIASTGILNMKIQSHDDSSFGVPTDISGAALTQIADTGDNNVYVIDVRDPTERYLRCVVTPATAASCAGVEAIRYGKRGTIPATQAAVQIVKV